ncbi:MAG: ImmA/IrrE family metallo-endopeptidase [Clostridiaceae bacterium]|jgi:Zn-dependent peptidase ImmA (M78 family)/fido (protein-threonine AMPylation protein)|nr:ImmA/IrrE family metallo-endopeptidase [Clostridiaceae bacterium]
MHFSKIAREYRDPEKMALAYLSSYFGDQKIEYPINPFQMLKDEGILFLFSDFSKLEGVYIPASGQDDISFVGININRPITRQRFTAAHELCHHFKDADKKISCPIYGNKSKIEKFADSFAAAVLMPINELRRQVKKRQKQREDITFDQVLEIAEYFGVSFEACLFRIAYHVHAISGDTEASALKKRKKSYAPDKKRKAKHMTYSKLYAGLIDCYQEQLSLEQTDHARFLFQSNYIYNDSRMEGLDVTREQAAEIVTDLRLNARHSKYCKEENEAYLSVAGHFEMYQDIFADRGMDKLSVFDIFQINRKLFLYYPHPEFGGSIRQSNTLVFGARFETTDYHNIIKDLMELDEEVKEFYERHKQIPTSEYVMHVARTHHRITQIHPFAEGNGRTARAFMNLQLVRAGLTPVYIKAENKIQYINALERADEYGDYDELYEVIFESMLRLSVDLRIE